MSNYYCCVNKNWNKNIIFKVIFEVQVKEDKHLAVLKDLITSQKKSILTIN